MNGHIIITSIIKTNRIFFWWIPYIVKTFLVALVITKLQRKVGKIDAGPSWSAAENQINVDHE